MTDSSAEPRKAEPARVTSLDDHRDRHPDEPSPAELARRLAPVAARLEADADDLAARQADLVQARFDSYAVGAAPRASIVESAHRNIRHLLAALRAGRPPSPEELDELGRTRERAVQGIPTDEMHDAYRAALRLLGDAFVDAAAACGLDQATTLAGTGLLWSTADVLTSVVVKARQEAELDLARSDEGQRVDFLRALVFDASMADLRKRAAAFGLPSDRSYWAVRAHAGEAGSGEVSGGEELRARLDAATRTYGCRPLLGVIDGDVVGVVPLRPHLDAGRFTIGIGGPLPLEAMPRAFATASRMLDVAVGFGLTGSFELRDLSVRVAVASEPDLGALLAERYLTPLQAEGDFGELLIETVSTHLAGGGRIVATAHRLGVHQNTVRHRLSRFEELTGAHLDDLDTTIELWWALTWRRHEGDR
ncbi:MAG: helix-turn-helix domain-containing protein [Actinomycetota bacterium]|nr:helix-turn-helix domain-containing protein [Actinomycetota bacterium]